MLGDATFPAPAMPKSGHMANQHAKVAAAAIIQLLKGEPVNATPVVMNTCYSFVTGRDAIHVASVHQYDAARQDLQDRARLGRRVGRGQPDRRRATRWPGPRTSGPTRWRCEIAAAPRGASRARMKVRLRRGVSVWVLALLWLAGQAAAMAAGAPRDRAPLLEGLDGDVLVVDSANMLARRYAQQGMLLAFGFNPEEAARSFEAALAIDPACASCWWALAWALGPTINADMSAPAAARVDRAVAQARRHAQRAAPTRRALIEALALRHPRAGSLDEAAYAQRMRMLAQRHPGDALVALLAAEALLNLHPYDWWSAQGTPRPWTAEIAALLERSMALDPRLAGAHHYWIHLQESSPHPQRAQASADFLRGAVPGSGHLLHMPAHIDMRVGRYAAAIEANQRSIEADRRYLAQVDAQGAYRVGYVAHNHHFLWAAASMAGREDLALQAALAAWPAACGPPAATRAAPSCSSTPCCPISRSCASAAGRRCCTTRRRRIRPSPTRWPCGTTPAARRVRAVARSNWRSKTWRSCSASAPIRRWRRLRMKNLNPAAPLVRIAVLTLQADLALAGGRPAQAVALLRQATAIEDALRVRRAPSVAGAHAPRPGRGAAGRRAGGAGRAGLSPGPAPLPGQWLVAERAGAGVVAQGKTRRRPSGRAAGAGGLRPSRPPARRIALLSDLRTRQAPAGPRGNKGRSRGATSAEQRCVRHGNCRLLTCMQNN